MAVTVDYALDEIQLAQLIADGWTHLTLWYANTPDGSYANASATVSPATLALMSSGEDYEATLTYSAGSPAQWFKVLVFDGSNYSHVSDAAPFHGGGGTTLAVIRQRLGKEIRDMRVGTLTTSTTTTSAVFATGDVTRFTDDYFNQHFFHNTTRGAWTQVTDWVQSTKTATVPAITSQASGDSVELTARFTPDEYRDAINWAIQFAYPFLSRTIVSTALRTATNIYQFDVPHDIKSVSSLEIESSMYSSSTVAATRGHPWRDVPFKIIRDGLRQKIELESFYAPDLRLRLIGTGPLSQLYNDSDYVEEIGPQVDLIVYYAAHHLYTGLTNDAASTDIDRYKQLADHYWTLAERCKPQHSQPRPAKRMWSPQVRSMGSNNRAAGSFSGSSY